MTHDQQKLLKQQYAKREEQQRQVNANLAKVARACLCKERYLCQKLAQALMKHNEKAAKGVVKEAQATADAPTKKAHAKVLRKAMGSKHNTLCKQKREE